MSHVDPGPLATYESLADPHLTGYFNNTRMRKHLKRMGLITSRGEIVSEKVFRLNNARKEHQRHIRDVLAQAIVHKALDMERHRQMHIKKQLEEISKIERVRRVRAERALRGDEDILPLLSPRSKQKKKQTKKEKIPILQTVTDSEDYEQRPPQSVGYPAMPSGPPYNTRAERMEMQYPNVEVDNQHLYELDRDALRSFTLNLSQFDLGSGVSPYSIPRNEETFPKKKQKKRPATTSGAPQRPRISRPRSNARSLRLHRREPPMMHRAQIHSLAKVAFKYLGQMVHLDHEEEDPRDEVVVMQQHCGGENIRIFKGMLMKGDKFVVISRRHRTFPFSLTFYLNGVQVERLSTCCEYKHKTGHKLGAKSSHFGIVRVEGSQPCFKCLIAQGKLKTRPDPSPPPSGGRTKPSRIRKKTKKAPKKEEESADRYEDDIPESSKSSTTTEDVQTDGPKAPSETSSSDVSSDSPLTSENESETESESDSESKLPSLKTGNDSDSYVSDSSDSQVRAKKHERIKSPKSRSSSVGKKRIMSPPNEKVKSPLKDSSNHSSRDESPTPVRPEVKSPTPPILKVEKSSSNASGIDEAKQSSSLGSHSSSSLSDAGDTVEEVSNDKANEKETSLKKSRNDPPAEMKHLTEETKPSASEIVERPLSPEPESSDSDSSDTLSVKRESDNDDHSILPLIKGKSLVDLTNRRLSSHQFEELTKYFDEDPGSLQIQELILNNCQLGDNKSKILLKALVKSTSLKSLDMSGNQLSSACIEDVLQVCYKDPIEHLNLANNPLRDRGCTDLLNGLTKSQANVVTAKLQKKVSQSLIASVLETTRREMSDEMTSSLSSASSMTSLASSVVSDTAFLQSLDLSNTNAGHETFTNLGHYLGLNPKLSHLNISGNSISATALELIIKPLANATNTFLKYLVMDNATLDDRHAELLSKNLVMKSGLTGLSLKGNRITEVGKEKLEDYKKANKSLEKLTLD